MSFYSHRFDCLNLLIVLEASSSLRRRTRSNQVASDSKGSERSLSQIEEGLNQATNREEEGLEGKARWPPGESA
jgi:hypothetical protein